MDVIALAIELSKLDFEVRAYVAEDRFQSLKELVAEHLSSSLGREDQVRVSHKDEVTTDLSSIDQLDTRAVGRHAFDQWKPKLN